MAGLPRVSYPSEMNIQIWLYYFFDPFTAYIINAIILHLVAFISARLILKEQFLNHYKHLIPLNHLNDKELQFFVNFSALYFALLPHWTLGGLSIAGMPLIFNAFLNILNKTYKIRDIIILILYPFYSYFIFSNIFLIFLLGIILIYDSFKNKRLNIKCALALVIFSVISLITEYRVILSTINGFNDHRTEFYHNNNLTFKNFIPNLIQSILNNIEFYYYSYSDATPRHYPFLFLFLLFSVFLSLLLNHKQVLKILVAGLLSTLILAYLYPLSKYVLFIIDAIFPSFLTKPIQGFTFRFYVLNPMIWLFILFVMSVYLSQLNNNSRKVFILILFLFDIYILFTTGKVLNFLTYRSLESPLSNNIKNKNIPITYASYYDEKLFKEIEEFIQKKYGLFKNQYRVAAITDPNPAYPLFSPSVLLYNNFYTIDGYCVYYPLSYKKIFQQIMNDSPEQNPFVRSLKYYGNRVYVGSTDTTHNGEIQKLNINTNVLKQLNCQFIFSRRKILDTTANLKLINHFEGMYWKINLYKVE